MALAPQTFDAVRYKHSTREQWETAAAAWHQWGSLLSQWLGPATELMLDMAGIAAGSRVLDVAAGAGEQTIAVARRLGRHGYVLATDISPTILTFAATMAQQAGLQNVATRQLDGESLTELEPESFDAVISRLGLIYFPDQPKALRGMRHVLKPGGKAAAIVYSTAEHNGFFSVPVGIIRRKANLPPPLPGQPGPFSLGGDGVLARALAEAGFRDISVKAVAAPLRLPSAAECLRFERESFGALHQMLAGLIATQQHAVWQEIEQALCQFETGGVFAAPCELLVAVGTK